MRVLAGLALLLLGVVAVSAGTLTFGPNDAKAHHTDKYRESNGAPNARVTILRRNQAFTVTVAGATPQTKYALVLGRESAELKVTKASAGSAELMHVQGAIGRFQLTATEGSSKLGTAEVIFIANPYVAADETFVPAKTNDLFPPEIAEHLENERGALWQGSSKQSAWIPWAYNQFDLSIIETTVDLLAPMTIAQRASTALVSRYLTSQSSEVLRGRWDGDYKDGKQPGFWASTTQIVAQYRSTKQTVKYGQCWVFAGLLTALCRSIGIPSRPLTNFDSAHEHAPFDQQCHTKYKKTGSGYERVEADNSIWNFHVWVDAWMTRPDIAGGKANGWQAIDATPQEQSSGPDAAPFKSLDYRCGPAPHASIKAMDVKGAYDVAFVAGEANCLKVDYVDGKEVSRDPSTVGETILTKSPDSKCNGVRMDSSKYSALCKSNLARSYSVAGSFLQVSQMFKASRFNVKAPTDGVRLGKEFKISVGPAAGYTGEAEYTVVLTAASYNSQHSFGTIKTAAGTTSTKGALIHITAADWGLPFIKDHIPSKTLTFDVLIVVKPKKGAAFVKHLMIPILTPRLAMLCGRKDRSYKKSGVIACNVVFQNPLPYALTKAVMSFSISGQGQVGLVKEQVNAQTIQTHVGPEFTAEQFDTDAIAVDATSRSVFKAKFSLNGAVGKQIIIAKLTSAELDGVHGVMEINVHL